MLVSFTELKYIESNLIKHRQWRKVDKYLLWTSFSSIVHKDVKDLQTILIPFEKSDNVLVGHFDDSLGIVKNVHEVDLKVISSKEDCFMELDWTLRGKKDFYLTLHDLKWSKVFLSNSKCSTALKQNSIESQFTLWDESMTPRVHQDYQSLILQLFNSMTQIEPREKSIFNLDKVTKNFMKIEKIYNSNNDIMAKMSHWQGPILPWKTNKVSFDQFGSLHGTCTFELVPEYLNQTGIPDFFDWSIKHFSGTFIHGQLDGLVLMRTWQGSIILATFHKGELHGPAISYGRTPVYDLSRRGFQLRRSMHSNVINKSLQFIGHFVNGKVHGHFWFGLLNNGYIHGKTNEGGLMSGEDISFIYPDGETALHGYFENTYMKKARHVEVTQYACDENNMLFAKEFTKPLSDDIFYYDHCTNASFGGGSLKIRDPYETKFVAVKPSTLTNGGDGVYLLKHMPKNKPVCFYSLFLYRKDEETTSFEKSCVQNTSMSDDYRRHCSKYTLDLITFKGTFNIPPEYDVEPLPNSGPKVNHHFSANNTVFKETEHPRWGMIQSVHPTIDLNAGQELFLYYDYERFGGQDEFPKDFPWYWKAKSKHEKESFD